MLLIALVDFMVLLRNLIKNIKKLIKNIEIYMHEILLIKGAKPNQKLDIVRYNREFVVTVIVITEFDCMHSRASFFKGMKIEKGKAIVPFYLRF